MSALRQELWRSAEAMSAALGSGLSPRARRLAARTQAPISMEDVRRAPDWAVQAPERRQRLARLAGAVAAARSWARTIDGEVLRRAGVAVGEPALDALLALPEVMTPSLPDPGAESGEAVALERLGGRILMAEGGHAPTLAPRLRRLLAAPMAGAREPDPEMAAAVRRTAEGMLAQFAFASSVSSRARS